MYNSMMCWINLWSPSKDGTSSIKTLGPLLPKRFDQKVSQNGLLDVLYYRANGLQSAEPHINWKHVGPSKTHTNRSTITIAGQKQNKTKT